MSNIENQFHNSLEKTRLRVRCPHCYKLYSVQTEEIQEARPKFECVDCHGRFWVAFPESLDHASGVIGFPIESAAEIANSTSANSAPAKANDVVAPVITKPFSCPKCGEAYAGGDRECTRCGVIFSKFSSNEPSRSEVSSSPELRDLWQAALDDYDNHSRHQQFLSYAQIEGNLEFALSKYNLILENCPTDAMAARAQNEAKALLVARLEARMPIMNVKSQSAFSDFLTTIPARIPGLRFGTLIIFMCGIVIAMGLFVPGLRNLVGVGSSILFFILALRYYFRAI